MVPLAPWPFSQLEESEPTETVTPSTHQTDLFKSQSYLRKSVSEAIDSKTVVGCPQLITSFAVCFVRGHARGQRTVPRNALMCKIRIHPEFRHVVSLGLHVAGVAVKRIRALSIAVGQTTPYGMTIRSNIRFNMIGIVENVKFVMLLVSCC